MLVFYFVFFDIYSPSICFVPGFLCEDVATGLKKVVEFV